MRWFFPRTWMGLRLGRDRARQIEAALQWINTVVREDDRILISFPDYGRDFRFVFPLRYEDPPWPVRMAGEAPTFIVRHGAAGYGERGTGWQVIYSSPVVEILESEKRPVTTPPLRWGLASEERLRALSIARTALVKFLESGKRLDQTELQNLPPRFFLKTDLDVALWVNGRLRGSMVLQNRNLGEGIAEAAILATRDSRFKPLAQNELPQTRIEITVMSALRIPLSIAERTENHIYPDKGYLLEYAGKAGWYLPEVLNVRRFRNLEEFLGDLAQDKAGLERSATSRAVVYTFEVDDLIESEDRERVLAIRGPIVKPEKPFTTADLESRLRAAADWLCRIQEPDGNIPPIIDPFTGRAVKQIDWPRLAFDAWALASFGKAIGERAYTEAADKSFQYLKPCVLQSPEFRIQNLELTLAYFGELALALGKITEALAAANGILPRLHTMRFEPITFAQIVSFFDLASRHTRELRQPSVSITATLQKEFETRVKRREPMNLALWAELVNTFHESDPAFSGQVAVWLTSQQLTNGAFPESTVSNFPYTRGTSKIAEVLALEPETNKKVLIQAFGWLITMQYDSENSFFTAPPVREKILGGFRHDDLNPEVWIDSAGHFLLAGARFLAKRQ